ncbi:hypothetical protein [uncultured Williamsia sp.]|uniref:hypothetical protein n=1 Tax=uncultured Williamsia sp. TaxID=259311 RepID=UPI00263926BD|nr:hypothetical protein [uncultured Williamsia sp.]
MTRPTLTSRVVRHCALVALATTIVGGFVTACSDEKADPAAMFSGTYSVTRLTASIDGTPATGTDAVPQTTTWVVQTSCAGPGNGCVAVASSTAADPSLPYDQDRMEFVLENGTWSRVVVPPTRPCVPEGLTAPVDEPWVALESASIRANDSASRLSGTLASVQGGSCAMTSEGSITLTRTGGLPSGTRTIGDVRVPAAVASPVEGFRGAYEETTRIVAWNPPTLIRTPTVQTTRFTAAPTCTRDATTCVVVMNGQDSQGSPTVAGFTGGPSRMLSQVETVGPRRCADGRSYRPVLTSTATLPEGDASPVQSITSTSTLAWTEACPGRVTFENDLRRIGD